VATAAAADGGGGGGGGRRRRRRRRRSRKEPGMRGTVRCARWTARGTALLVAAALGACTADDGAGNLQAVPTSAASSGDVTAVCDAAVELEASFAVDLLAAARITDPEQQAVAFEEWNATVRQQLHDVEDSAPPEVADDVETGSTFFYDFLTFSELSVFEDPEYQRADDDLDDYRLAECGYPHVEATGADFAYEGFPATVPAGVVAFTVTNEGDEQHEMVVTRIDDDVTTSFAEVLALPEDQASSMTTTVGRLFPLLPGAAESTFIRMDPGRYGVACYLSQGTTEDTEGSGPPHHSLGMVAEFTVA
jgi:hypothetical protein